MAIAASADEAAVLARWLRDSFASSPDLVFFTSEEALELGDAVYEQIPVHGGLKEITQVLQEHLANADRQ